MRGTLWWTIAVLGFALAVACGTHVQPVVVEEEARTSARDVISEESVALYAERRARLLRVSHALRTAGVEICRDEVGPILGLAVWEHEERYFESFFRALERVYGVGKGELVVVSVLKDSPAERAGIRVRDHVVAVNGRNVKHERDVFQSALAVREGPVKVTVLRDDERLSFDVEPVLACRHEAFLTMSDWLSTFRAKGNHVAVTSAILAFAETDAELAFAIAHEMGRRLPGVSILPGPETEIRAAELGLYLAARAGYDVSLAPSFWDRLVLEHPWSVEDETRYNWLMERFPDRFGPERSVAVRVGAEEIRAKLDRGEPLVPSARVRRPRP